MQDYTYSVFSSVAIAIHLIINFRLLFGRSQGFDAVRVSRYRGFLAGVLAYYVSDAAWGLFAGLHWIGPWYVDTVMFFLSMAFFAFMWGRFVVVYLDFGKWQRRAVMWSGYALLAFNVLMLTANVFNNCFFRFDENGTYILGGQRDLPFHLLIAFVVMMTFFVLAKALRSRDAVRRRAMMSLVFCVTMAVAIVLQVIWPLTPFTALGCLTGNCFFHFFVIADEQAAKHMAELESALARARAAEKARSMFFSIVSHDIRTPLNAILGYSELLQSGGGGQVGREEALRSIRASGTTLLQLIDNVLDLSKVDSGAMAFHAEPVLLSRLVGDVFATFRMDASGKGVELVNRTADVPSLMLDERRFRQIVFNLVGNAVKFTERGSVKVSASYDGAKLEVAVSDTGCGIAPDMLRRVLDPFVQVLDPSHAADRSGGTGLGLSICRSLVEAMGGKLVVESEVGKGSTFKVCIPGVKKAEEDKGMKGSEGVKGMGETSGEQHSPAVKNPFDPVDPLNPSVPRDVSKLRVLVVDDSPVNRSVLKAFLKKAGIATIDTACDGEEALEELEQAVKTGNPHDFVFSDYWMPKMNGLELIEKLRADSRFSDLPVFAATADTEFHKDPRSALFNGILLKPLTYAKIVEAFASASPRG